MMNLRQLSRQLVRTYSSYYSDLNLDRTASSEDIKEAYFRLSKTYHPDLNKDDAENIKTFHKIAEAYRVLGNAKLRRQYDQRILEGGSASRKDFVKHKFEGKENYEQRTKLQRRYQERQSMEDFVHSSRRKEFLRFQDYKKRSSAGQQTNQSRISSPSQRHSFNPFRRIVFVSASIMIVYLIIR